ncbi:MAG: aldose 1-epimerase family protein [Treponema sp.]|nr:aldose 1-epimerase family protein [Treponema sp.]
MLIKIENALFSAEIDTKGAELQNFIRKSDKKDIIWHGDKSVWGNHAPILFPFVARCLGGYFMIDGKKCEYSRNHGFARDLEHKLISNTEDSAIFELSESKDTDYRFPYAFCLRTEYKLTEKGLEWKITVKNTDQKDFYFGVGTHAAFDLNGGAAEDFLVEFEKHEGLCAVECNPDGYLAAGADAKSLITKEYGEKEKGFIPVTDAGFGNGHLFTNFTSSWVGLRNKKDGSIVKISTEGFPYCMIWQNTSGKPQFVCIEPWHGLPDSEKTDHIWENKIGMNLLKAGQSFVSRQDITVE